MSIDKIEQRAAAACRAKSLQFVMAAVPPAFRDNAAVIRHLLTSVAEAWPEFANSAPYASAHSALHELEQARNLRDEVARLYHDPAIRAKFGDAEVERAWANPEVAYRQLIQQSAGGVYSPEVDRALSTLGEYRQFASENGIAEPVARETPLPSDAGKVEAEIKTLRSKSVAGTLSKAEDQRLTALYEQRIGREDTAAAAEIASHAKALGMRDRPAGAYQALIEKSIAGRLTPEEDARLTEMSGDLAVSQGLITQEDLDAEQE